jgi:DNA-binding NarL/FixJ family response regulator
MPPQPASQPALPSAPPVTPLRTFVVEDSIVVRDNLVAALEELLPVKVVGVAEDAAYAVSWMRDAANRCDLGIVDIFLKRGTGLDVLAAATATRKDMKWVVFTNFASTEMRKRCGQLGADRVFDKSNEIETLILYCESLADGTFSTVNGATADDATHRPIADGPVD